VLTRKFLTVYGIVGVVIMTILFVLVVFRLVPTSWFLPLFIIAFTIWGSRLILRLFVLKKEQREAEGSGEEATPLNDSPDKEMRQT
jgi:hypothetical protein